MFILFPTFYIVSEYINTVICNSEVTLMKCNRGFTTNKSFKSTITANCYTNHSLTIFFAGKLLLDICMEHCIQMVVSHLNNIWQLTKVVCYLAIWSLYRGNTISPYFYHKIKYIKSHKIHFLLSFYFSFNVSYFHEWILPEPSFMITSSYRPSEHHV